LGWHKSHLRPPLTAPPQPPHGLGDGGDPSFDSFYKQPFEGASLSRLASGGFGAAQPRAEPGRSASGGFGFPPAPERPSSFGVPPPPPELAPDALGSAFASLGLEPPRGAFGEEPYRRDSPSLAQLQALQVQAQNASLGQLGGHGPPAPAPQRRGCARSRPRQPGAG
jgi:hypothetical protein